MLMFHKHEILLHGMLTCPFEKLDQVIFITATHGGIQTNIEY
jgi:hypothetical protein